MTDDEELLRRQKAFLFEAEKAIRAANREIIHGALPELDRDAVYRLAVAVARLRAAYLQTALKLEVKEDGRIADSLVAELKDHRERFEEARDAFVALQRAIEIGYIDITKEETGAS